MQVLLKKSETSPDIQCSVCNQGFRLYWERNSDAERETMRSIILSELRGHHTAKQDGDIAAAAHPEVPFNLPSWSGAPQFSGAALLGGLSGVHQARRTTRSRDE